MPEVTAVRHLHAWSITEDRPMVTLEAVVPPAADPDAARRRIKARLADAFGFDHATVEICVGRARKRPVAGAGLRVYLDALASPRRASCRSRSPRPFPPTTCSGARA